MLSAEALRLSAIEVLCPTAACVSGSGFPTLAGINVFDSRAVAIQDIDPTKAFTPVLALFTSKAGVKPRSDIGAADDTEAFAVLDIVAELAVASSDDDGEYADAMAGDDPQARLVLAALCSQVRFLLERSLAGGIWRKIVRNIESIDEEAFAAPDLGLRWQRITIRMHCNIRDDDFDFTSGSLPEPMASLYALLPDQSYAKQKLADLAAHFTADNLPRLQEIRVTAPASIVSGVSNLSP